MAVIFANVEELQYSRPWIFDHHSDGTSVYQTVVDLLRGDRKVESLGPLEVRQSGTGLQSLSDDFLYSLKTYHSLLRSLGIKSDPLLVRVALVDMAAGLGSPPAGDPVVPKVTRLTLQTPGSAETGARNSDAGASCPTVRGPTCAAQSSHTVSAASGAVPRAASPVDMPPPPKRSAPIPPAGLGGPPSKPPQSSPERAPLRSTGPPTLPPAPRSTHHFGPRLAPQAVGPETVGALPIQLEGGTQVTVVFFGNEVVPVVYCEDDHLGMYQRGYELLTGLVDVEGLEDMDDSDPAVLQQVCLRGFEWCTEYRQVRVGTGRHRGLRGIGLGSTKKKRIRAARVALAAAAVLQATSGLATRDPELLLVAGAADEMAVQLQEAGAGSHHPGSWEQQPPLLCLEDAVYHKVPNLPGPQTPASSPLPPPGSSAGTSSAPVPSQSSDPTCLQLKSQPQLQPQPQPPPQPRPQPQPQPQLEPQLREHLQPHLRENLQPQLKPRLRPQLQPQSQPQPQLQSQPQLQPQPQTQQLNQPPRHSQPPPPMLPHGRAQEPRTQQSAELSPQPHEPLQQPQSQQSQLQELRPQQPHPLQQSPDTEAQYLQPEQLQQQPQTQQQMQAQMQPKMQPQAPPEQQPQQQQLLQQELPPQPQQQQLLQQELPPQPQLQQVLSSGHSLAPQRGTEGCGLEQQRQLEPQPQPQQSVSVQGTAAADSRATCFFAVAAANYEAEGGGYLSVRAGDRVRLTHTRPEPGEGANAHRSYVYGELCSSLEKGWLPMDILPQMCM